MKIRSLLPTLGLVAGLVTSINASAVPIVLTFEGVADLTPVGDFYNGAGGPSLNLGVSFSPTGLGLIDQDAPGGPPFGSGVFANEPSPSTVLTFRDVGSVVLNYAAGFNDGFALYYVSADNAFVRAWTGLDGTGTMLAEMHLEDQKVTGPGDPLPINGTPFGVWVPVGLAFTGTAQSLTFFGGPTVAAFDNVTLGSVTAGIRQTVVPAGVVPEPSVYLLMALGLIGMRFTMRRA